MLYHKLEFNPLIPSYQYDLPTNTYMDLGTLKQKVLLKIVKLNNCLKISEKLPTKEMW